MKVTDLLRTMDIFEQLPAEDLEKIARLLRERRLAEGEVLMRQGEPGDAMYVVTGGKIRLAVTDPNGNEKVLTHFTDGQFFGETALLTGAPRAATATAESESRVLVLPKADFDALMSSNAQIMREMLKVLSQRTVQTNQALLADDSTGPSTAGAGRVYAVFSPRGGSGKSTIAVNLATALAQQAPERVGLLDLSLTFGHTALLLNIVPESSLAAVPPESLESLDRQVLGRYFVSHPVGLQLLVGGTRPEEGEAVTGDHVRAALRVMKRQFQTIVVDCNGSFSDPILAALEVADKIVLVCTPELNTLRDIRECQRIFGEVVHIEKGKTFFLLNYYQPFKVLSREQFEGALEQQVNVEVPHAGEAGIKAAMKGEPLVLAAPSSPFARAIDRLVWELTPEDQRSSKAPGRGKAPDKGAAVAATSSPNGAHAAKPKGLLALFNRKR